MSCRCSLQTFHITPKKNSPTASNHMIFINNIFEPQRLELTLFVKTNICDFTKPTCYKRLIMNVLGSSTTFAHAKSLLSCEYHLIFFTIFSLNVHSFMTSISTISTRFILYTKPETIFLKAGQEVSFIKDLQKLWQEAYLNNILQSINHEFLF